MAYYLTFPDPSDYESFTVTVNGTSVTSPYALTDGDQIVAVLYNEDSFNPETDSERTVFAVNGEELTSIENTWTKDITDDDVAITFVDDYWKGRFTLNATFAQTMLSAKVDSTDGIILATQGKYCASDIKVKAVLEEVTVTPGSTAQTSTPSEGYAGIGKVTVSKVSTQTKTVTPSTAQQVFTPSTGKYFSKVTVKAIPSSYIVPSGELEITENGTYDVTNYASVIINISSPTPQLTTPTIGINSTNSNIVEVTNYVLYAELENVFYNWILENEGGEQYAVSTGNIAYIDFDDVLDEKGATSGDYTVTVSITADGYTDSAVSNSVSVTYEETVFVCPTPVISKGDETNVFEISNTDEFVDSEGVNTMYTFEWNFNDEGTEYTHSTKELSINVLDILNEQNADSGEYSVNVIAKYTGYTDSPSSNVLQYVYTKLPTPIIEFGTQDAEAVHITNFSSFPSGTVFELWKDGTELAGTTTTGGYNLSDYDLEAGSYQITVTAAYNGQNTTSNALTFVVEATETYDFDVSVGGSFDISYQDEAPDVVIDPSNLAEYYDDGGVLVFTAKTAGTGTVTINEGSLGEGQYEKSTVYTVRVTNNLISFTFSGTSYQAEQNMTWAQFIDSSYNDGTFSRGDKFGGTIYYVNKDGKKVTCDTKSEQAGSRRYTYTDETIVDGYYYSHATGPVPS